MRGLQTGVSGGTGRDEIYVKVTQLDTGYTWYWPKQKFVRRKYAMQEMFEDFQNGDEDWKVPVERDPFVESPDLECLVGVAQVYLQCVSYRVWFLLKFIMFCVMSRTLSYVEYFLY